MGRIEVWVSVLGGGIQLIVGLWGRLCFLVFGLVFFWFFGFFWLFGF